jgi:hypothetical protein
MHTFWIELYRGYYDMAMMGLFVALLLLLLLPDVLAKSAMLLWLFLKRLLLISTIVKWCSCSSWEVAKSIAISQTDICSYLRENISVYYNPSSLLVLIIIAIILCRYRLLEIKQRQKEEADHIEDTQRLVAEIEMLKVVRYLVSRKQQ